MFRNDGGRLIPTLWPRQAQVAQSKAQWVFAFGSKQSGKSYGVFYAFAMYMLQHSTPANFLTVTPGWGLMDSATYPKLMSVLEPMGIAKRADYHGTHKRIISDTLGHTLYFRISKEWERLQSMTLQGVLGDEFQDQTKDVFMELNARIANMRGRGWGTFTVPRPENIKSHWIWPIYDQWQKEKQMGIENNTYDFIQFLPFDSPYWTDERLAQIRREISDEEFRAFYLGDMNVELRDDRLFPAGAIEAAMQRHLGVMKAKVPVALYDYVCSQQPTGQAYLPKRDWDDNKVQGGVVTIGNDPAGATGKDVIGTTLQYEKYPIATWDWGKMGLSELEGRLIAMSRDLRGMGFEVVAVVDSTGLGHGVPDHLADEGVDAIMHVPQAKARDPMMYQNLKAELHFQLRDMLVQDPDFVLPPCQQLKVELLGTAYGENSSGKRQIKRQKPSPNLKDSLVCAMRETLFGGVQIFIGAQDADAPAKNDIWMPRS